MTSMDYLVRSEKLYDVYGLFSEELYDLYGLFS